MVFKLFRRPPHREQAGSLYRAAVGQSRRAEFFEKAGVLDTVDGRFDLLALHVFFILRRLKADREKTEDLAQTLFDLMFKDMDQNLRQMGVGDLGVGGRVKKMAKAFYGRIAAYESGLEAEDDKILADALARNLYRGHPPEDALLKAMAAYVRRQDAALASQGVEDLMAGQVAFATFEEMEDRT